jgi:hypothetical protein
MYPVSSLSFCCSIFWYNKLCCFVGLVPFPFPAPCRSFNPISVSRAIHDSLRLTPASSSVVFETPQLLQLIRRTDKLILLTRAEVMFYCHPVEITPYASVGPAKLEFQVPCKDSGLEWHISSRQWSRPASTFRLSSLVRNGLNPRPECQCGLHAMPGTF